MSRECALEQIYCETNLLLLSVMRVRGKAWPRSSASIAVSSLHTRDKMLPSSVHVHTSFAPLAQSAIIIQLSLNCRGRSGRLPVSH